MTTVDVVLRPAEVAAMFRVSAKTVTRWQQSGRLKAQYTPGGHRLFPASEVNKLLRDENPNPHNFAYAGELPEKRDLTVPKALKSETARIRAWARNNGFEIGERGRIPADIVEAYESSLAEVNEKPSPVEIREWARCDGREVSDRGRLPEALIQDYKAAQRQAKGFVD